MLEQDNVLYRRPKESDMVQGILDTVQLLLLERDKMQRFGYNPYPSEFGHLWSTLEQWRNVNYDMQYYINKLRAKGL